MQIKQISADGSFEGILAVYSNVDLGGDVIVPGAFTKTIQEHGSTVPLLWQHQPSEPIGTLVLSDTPQALNVKGQLLMDLPLAQKAYLLLKAKIIRGMSIGYDTIKDTVDNDVRYLKELRLWEGSIVTFPMNEMAMVTAIKAVREGVKGDFDTELAAQQLNDAGQQIFQALYYALSSNTWSSAMSSDEKVQAAQETLTQFTDAYMAYLPAYLAWLDAEYGTIETMARGRMQKKMLNARVFIIEAKEGRELSAANVEKLKAAFDHVKGISPHVDGLKSIFQTLLPDEAVDPADDVDDDEVADPDLADDTSSAKAAKEKTEPESKGRHSAVINTVDSIIALIPKSKAS
jgi:hypothetical protein